MEPTLSLSDLESLARTTARSIEQRGLRVACLWLLEAHLPLRGVLHAAIVGAAPMVGMLLGSREAWRDLSLILDSAEGVEALLNALDRQQVESCTE